MRPCDKDSLTAGISCKRHYPDKRVIIIRKEGTVLIPCGIPYIFGTVGGPENNVVPDGLLEKNGIELIKDEATRVNREAKVVYMKDHEPIAYDKAVFATGSLPVVPPIPGVEKKNVFPVKKDFAYLKEVLKTMDTAKDIVIIGGGFIGVEFADECRKVPDGDGRQSPHRATRRLHRGLRGRHWRKARGRRTPQSGRGYPRYRRLAE